MRTTATVISVNGKFATVETERTSACEGCHKMAEDGKGCAVCGLMGGGHTKFTATAENRAGAQVGDRVAVESATSRVMLYAALVFLLPLVICFLGWWITSLITPDTRWQISGAAIGFCGTFVALRIFSGARRGKQADVVITEILPNQ